MLVIFSFEWVDYIRIAYRIIFSVSISPKGGGGGGHSLNWPWRVCVPEQGMVFRVLDRNRLKNLKVGYKLSTLVLPAIFYQKIQFDDVILKNYLVLYAKRNESGPKIRSLVLSRVWVWRPRRQNFTQTIPWVHPSGTVRYVFLEISESPDWSAMFCSSSVGINIFVLF